MSKTSAGLAKTMAAPIRRSTGKRRYHGHSVASVYDSHVDIKHTNADVGNLINDDTVPFCVTESFQSANSQSSHTQTCFDVKLTEA